jgi:anti-sigma regulatory factor (Ser/Thr protein kinase)
LIQPNPTVRDRPWQGKTSGTPTSTPNRGDASFRGAEMRLLLSCGLPPDATAPGLARRAVAGLPPGLVADPGDLRLMVSELVTNSVRHGGLAPSDRIQLQVFEMDPGIHVEVRDPGSGYAEASEALGSIPEPPGPDEPLAEGGFGMMVTAALSDRFGVRRDEGTVMWFEVNGDRPRRASAPGG